MNFIGIPFSFSGLYNIFILVGCDNIATIDAIDHKVFGCTSDCNTDVKKIESGGLSCSGFNYCATNVPYNLQVFAVNFGSINGMC